MFQYVQVRIAPAYYLYDREAPAAKFKKKREKNTTQHSRAIHKLNIQHIGHRLTALHIPLMKGERGLSSSDVSNISVGECQTGAAKYSFTKIQNTALGTGFSIPCCGSHTRGSTLANQRVVEEVTASVISNRLPATTRGSQQSLSDELWDRPSRNERRRSFFLFAALVPYGAGLCHVEDMRLEGI